MENRRLIHFSLLVLVAGCLVLGMTETVVALLSCIVIFEVLIALSRIKQLPAQHAED